MKIVPLEFKQEVSKEKVRRKKKNLLFFLFFLFFFFFRKLDILFKFMVIL